MENQSASKSHIYFLGGIIVLGVAIIGGLVWALMSPVAPSTGGVETNLKFTDTNDPFTGPADAKVVLRNFGDFQCPACAAAEPGVDYVRQKYGSQVKLVWDDFPLTSVHPNAMAGANAARCAEDQGKFWEFHDALYKAQNQWASLPDPGQAFAEYAQQLGLKVDAFKACYAASNNQPKIQADMSEGNANNVDATPTFFLNNRRYVGTLTNAQWDAAIAQALKESGS